MVILLVRSLQVKLKGGHWPNLNPFGWRKIFALYIGASYQTTPSLEGGGRGSSGTEGALAAAPENFWNIKANRKTNRQSIIVSSPGIEILTRALVKSNEHFWGELASATSF